MKALIIANGQIIDTSIIRKYMEKEDVIICCDGGVKYSFKEGITPHYILGDLDSANQEIIKFFQARGVILKKFPEKKDFTDMELCIQFSISLDVDEIILLGAIGSRFDHSLANVNLLKKCINHNVKAKIINENNEISLTDNEIEIYGKKNDLVSLLPLSSEVIGVTTSELYYHLEDYTMKIGESLGISNVMLSDRCSIKVKKGYLLVIKAID